MFCSALGLFRSPAAGLAMHFCMSMMSSVGVSCGIGILVVAIRDISDVILPAQY
jgi:hypothetical protein